jgi:hypothetical protein
MKKISLLVVFCFVFSLVGNAKVIYVKKNSGFSSQDGKSWATAYWDLQYAINIANNNDEIWVASNTYEPRFKANNYMSANSSDPLGHLSADNAFVLRPNIKIYGGFAGNETLFSQRDVVNNPTILKGFGMYTGPIGGPLTPILLSYHVVISAGDVGTACLDGFTIQEGRANATDAITVNNKSIYKDCGGGIYITFSSPTLKNLIIERNHAINDGGGLYIEYSSSVIENVVVQNNSANHEGGGMFFFSSNVNWSNLLIRNNESINGGGFYVANSSVKIQNILVAENQSSNNGGGICILNSTGEIINATITNNNAFNGGGIADITPINLGNNNRTLLQNCIVWGNNASGQNPNAYTLFSNLLLYDYSLIQGISVSGLSSLTINIHVNMNPMLTNDYKLRYEIGLVSPCIGLGNNSYNTTTKDLAGNTRKIGTIDLGAYETINAPYPVPPSSKCNFDYDLEYDYQSGLAIGNQIELNVFPNPVNSNQQINISLGKYDKPVGVRIYSLEGKLIHNKTCEGSSFGINVPDLASGIYMIHVQSQEGERFTKKILVN